MFAIDLTGGWRLGLGDPTVMGWLTVGAYVVAACLCWFAAAREVRLQCEGDRDLSPRLWYLLTAALLFMGVNKQLDIQSLFTVVGRQVVRHLGWMERRRVIQAVGVAMLALLGLGMAVISRIQVRKRWTRYRMAWVGMVVLICFIVVRASSFHHVDRMLGLGWASFAINHLMELSGIALVTVGACRAASCDPE